MKRTLIFLSWLALTLLLGTAIMINPAPAQAKALNFALAGNPDTLDPHKTSGTLTFQTIKSVYDTLAEPDMSGKLVPALAERWQVSDDALTWTFYLRKGVVFHNGDKLTAQDVKATLSRVMDKATAGVGVFGWVPSPADRSNRRWASSSPTAAGTSRGIPRPLRAA